MSDSPLSQFSQPFEMKLDVKVPMRDGVLRVESAATVLHDNDSDYRVGRATSKIRLMPSSDHTMVQECRWSFTR